MTMLPNPDAWDTDITELPPDEAKQRVEDAVGLSPTELEQLQDTPRYEEYHDESNKGQEDTDGPIPGGPAEDVHHLLTTPADEWDDDEFAEADEWENYVSRTVPQYGPNEGDPIFPDKEPDIHRGEMALLTWGIQPSAESDNFID